MRLNALTALIMARKMKISWRRARSSEDSGFLTLSPSHGFCNTFPIHSWLFLLDSFFPSNTIPFPPSLFLWKRYMVWAAFLVLFVNK